MARTVYRDRVEVFAFIHPDDRSAMVRVLKETIELIQRPDNRGAFDLSATHFKIGLGEIRVVLPFPVDVERDDAEGLEYDMTGES